MTASASASAVTALAKFLPSPVDHGSVSTTTACEVEVSRVVSDGVTTYAVSGDVETEGIVIGPYRVALAALTMFGCPSPANCLSHTDYDLDFRAGLSDR